VLQWLSCALHKRKRKSFKKTKEKEKITRTSPGVLPCPDINLPKYGNT